MLLVSGCFFDNDSQKRCVYQKIIYNSFPFVSKQSETRDEKKKEIRNLPAERARQVGKMGLAFFQLTIERTNVGNLMEPFKQIKVCNVCARFDLERT